MDGSLGMFKMFFVWLGAPTKTNGFWRFLDFHHFYVVVQYFLLECFYTMGFLLLSVVNRGSQIVDFVFMIMSLGGLSGDHVRDIWLWILMDIYQRFMELSYWSGPLDFLPIDFQLEFHDWLLGMFISQYLLTYDRDFPGLSFFTSAQIPAHLFKRRELGRLCIQSRIDVVVVSPFYSSYMQMSGLSPVTTILNFSLFLKKFIRFIFQNYVRFG